MWGGFVCSPSLFEGMSAPKAVGPLLVEKDWVFRGCVSFKRREAKRGQTFSSGREEPWSLEIGNLLVGGHETYRHAYQVGSTWHSPFEVGLLGLSFGSREVPESHVAWPVAPEGSPSECRPPSSCLRLVGLSLALDT
jgi:hypothetical protein